MLPRTLIAHPCRTSCNSGYAASLPVGRFAQIAAPLVKEDLPYRMNGCIKTTGHRYDAATSRTRETLVDMLGELNGCAAVRGGTMRRKNLEEPQNISEIKNIKFKKQK